MDSFKYYFLGLALSYNYKVQDYSRANTAFNWTESLKKLFVSSKVEVLKKPYWSFFEILFLTKEVVKEVN